MFIVTFFCTCNQTQTCALLRPSNQQDSYLYSSELLDCYLVLRGNFWQGWPMYAHLDIQHRLLEEKRDAAAMQFIT